MEMMLGGPGVIVQIDESLFSVQTQGRTTIYDSNNHQL